MKKLRPSGGYRDTASFQTATIIYDATVWFCEQFLDPRSRTVDQMVQAARSGRQNIAEGSRASAASSQTELRLVNVARASLEELLLDYEDFLRHRRLARWGPDDPDASAVRAVPRSFRKDPTDQADLTDLSDEQRYALYFPLAGPPQPRRPRQRPHGPAHRQVRKACRTAILGLHQIPRVQRHPPHPAPSPAPIPMAASRTGTPRVTRDRLLLMVAAPNPQNRTALGWSR